jgi:adenylate kinase family enzyme
LCWTGSRASARHRPDDRDPNAVERRIADFLEFTVPVIEEYRESARLVEIDAARESEVVYEDLRDRLASLVDP